MKYKFRPQICTCYFIFEAGRSFGRTRRVRN